MGAAPPEYEEPCLEDAAASFEELPNNGSKLAFWSGELGDDRAVIPWPRYSMVPANRFGLNNHFQGVQRLASGPYLAITGSDKNTQTAELFIVHLDSRSAQGMWESNLSRSRHPGQRWRRLEQPAQNDRLIARVDLDKDLWHAGGLDAMGDLLAIPLTDGGASQIVFYDVAQPAQPTQLAPSIDRTDSKALAVAITRLPDERYVVATLTDSSIDFNVSRSAELMDGFDDLAAVRWQAAGHSQDMEPITDAQNLNFVAQCDGTLFLLGLWNTTSYAPVIPGENVALLYQVSFPGGSYTRVPTLQLRARKEFSCGSDCNFDGAAGAYVSADRRLVLYSTYHFRIPLTLLDLVLRGPSVVWFSEF